MLLQSLVAYTNMEFLISEDQCNGEIILSSLIQPPTTNHLNVQSHTAISNSKTLHLTV